MPRVSILLTCYNHLDYLKPAWEAMQAQTFKDFEVLALDDGSTDGSRDWLREQEKEEPRLRCIFNEKNLGTYATLNVGLGGAEGEFIAILNDDDLWAPEKLAKQVEAMEADPKVGLVHTGGWFIDESGGKHPDPAPLGFVFPRSGDGDILAEEIYFNHIITSSVLLRRKVFEKCGQFNDQLFGSGDWEMWLRIAREFQAKYVDEPLTFYRVHGANASHAKEKIHQDDARIREWIASWQSEYEPGMPSSLRQAFAHNWACLGTVYGWAGKAGAARRAYGRSIKMLPLRLKSYLRWLLTFLPRKAFRKLE